MAGVDASGWPVRFVGSGVLAAEAVVAGRPYIARIAGRDATYRWRREFLKTRLVWLDRERALCQAQLNISKYPAVLELRWGPLGRYGKCEYRAFFMVSDENTIESVAETAVGGIIDGEAQVIEKAKARAVPTQSHRFRVRPGEEV